MPKMYSERERGQYFLDFRRAHTGRISVVVVDADGDVVGGGHVCTFTQDGRLFVNTGLSRRAAEGAGLQIGDDGVVLQNSRCDLSFGD